MIVDHRREVDAAEQLLGIVTERDLTKAIVDYAIGLVEQRVEDVMTHPVVTCAPDKSVVEALFMMNSRHIRHLPILDRDKLAGIVSIRDVTGKRIELLELENRQLRDPVS